MKKVIFAVCAMLLASTACGRVRDTAISNNFSDPQVVRFVSCVARNDRGSLAACRLTRDKINMVGRNGQGPLLWLLSHEHVSPEAMAALVGMGADPYQGPETASGYVIRERPIAYLEALVAAGVDINRLRRVGESERGFDEVPIFSAIMAHDYDKVKFLIDHGANLEIRNHVGETPLLFADLNTYAIQILLLESGADPSARDADGHGVCWAIENNPHHETVESFEPQLRQAARRDIEARHRLLEILRGRGIACQPGPTL